MAWKIDPAHSQVEFTVRHMMISNVRGSFEKFDGTVEVDESDLKTAKIDVRIDAASINTREPQRDAHLKSPDFLDVENHPHIHFRSTNVEQTDAKHLVIRGMLTIRDVSREVTLDTEFQGIMKSPWGTTSAGFSATARINRTDFGLTWNQMLEAGGLLVGDEVKISIEVELMKEASPNAEQEVKEAEQQLNAE